jgi:ABC-type multidrug transport system fused ATPase/permease subunit
VIQGARVVERGTPSQLTTAGGPFAALFATGTHATHPTNL